MTSRSRLGRLSRPIVGAVLLGATALACVPAAPHAPGTPGGSAGASSTTPPTQDAGVSASPRLPGLDAPPDARLSAEGGDPVTGQLGTYVWLETGSDAPWLPGTPLTVGAGEPLTLALVPDGEIGAWRARHVPADAPGPDGAAVLGEGTGFPAFDAPGVGAWTVEVFIEFANGVGSASYFWRLEVE